MKESTAMPKKESSAGFLKKAYIGFCGFFLSMAVLISLYEIVSRVIFKSTYDFIIDFSVWLTVWAMLLMMGPLLAEGGHVSIDYIRDKLHGKARMMLELFNTLCCLIYGLAITWGGIQLVQSLYIRKSVFPRYFAVPMFIIELCVPISMAIFSYFALVEILRVFRPKAYK
ncbi:MAG TPA: TRAP transporter small permease [Alphaproteobacteria bacterium]|nr:TRAP transporter small permease [Alphaproteobacteria bacterium]